MRRCGCTRASSALRTIPGSSTPPATDSPSRDEDEDIVEAREGGDEEDV